MGTSASRPFHLSANTHDVGALGVVWGGGTINGVDTSVYSDIGDVKAEIGSLQVCADGFNC